MRLWRWCTSLPGLAVPLVKPLSSWQNVTAVHVTEPLLASFGFLFLVFAHYLVDLAQSSRSTATSGRRNGAFMRCKQSWDLWNKNSPVLCSRFQPFLCIQDFTQHDNGQQTIVKHFSIKQFYFLRCHPILLLQLKVAILFYSRIICICLCII